MCVFVCIRPFFYNLISAPLFKITNALTFKETIFKLGGIV